MIAQLIMTTAERDEQIEIMRRNMQDPDAYDAIAMLQSLPVVSKTPVAYLAYFFIEPTPMTTATNDAGYEVVEPTVENAFPVYTSPQALTPITADDVQLMAFNDCSDDWNDPKYREIWLEGYVAGAHAAIAEVKHRSEAR